MFQIGQTRWHPLAWKLLSLKTAITAPPLEVTPLHPHTRAWKIMQLKTYTMSMERVYDDDDEVGGGITSVTLEATSRALILM